MTTTNLHTPLSWWIQTDSADYLRTGDITTAELPPNLSAINTAPRHQRPTTPVENLNLTSPVTAPCRIVAQMTNFASPAKDCGRRPTTTPLAFVRKAAVDSHVDRPVFEGTAELLNTSEMRCKPTSIAATRHATVIRFPAALFAYSTPRPGRPQPTRDVVVRLSHRAFVKAD